MTVDVTGFFYRKLIRIPYLIRVAYAKWTREGLTHMLLTQDRKWKFTIRAIAIGPFYIALIDGRQK